MIYKKLPFGEFFVVCVCTRGVLYITERGCMPTKDTVPCCAPAFIFFGTMAMHYRFEYDGQVWKKHSHETAILDMGTNPEPRTFTFYTPVTPYHRCVCRT